MKKEYIDKAAIAMYSYIKKYQMDILSGKSKESVEKIEMSIKEYNNEILFADRKVIGFWHRIEGILMEDHFNTYIVFMATNRWWDWLTNLNFFKVSLFTRKDKEIKIHNGYLSRYILDDVRTKILIYLAESKKKNVIVTGYSMGGGLAPICALDLATNFPEKEIHCVAMAGPRIGNKHFASHVDKHVDAINLIYGNDAVTKVPPPFFGFKHVNKKHYGPKRCWWKFKILDHTPDNLFNAIYKKAC